MVSELSAIQEKRELKSLKMEGLNLSASRPFLGGPVQRGIQMFAPQFVLFRGSGSCKY